MQPNRTIFLSFLLLLLLLTGCVPSTLVTEGEKVPSEADSLMQQAEALKAVGDYAGAAALFEQLARQNQPPARQVLLLRAAENLFQAEENEAATVLLARINTAALPQLDFQKSLLVAEMALARNRPDEALLLLMEAPQPEIAVALLQRYHQDRAEGFRLSGNLLESARELSELDRLIQELEPRLENQMAILQTLAALTDTALDLLQPSPPGIQGGWMELARVIKGTAGDTRQIQQLIEAWREKFPSHPAMPDLLDGYFQKLKALYRRPNHLAILLPMSGPYANAARALREGFMAAYYQQPAENRPYLAFYDSSNSADTWPLYQQAVDAGAEMVIGPLNKEGVAQMARAGELEVPVLALNQIPPMVTPPADLYQFGLSPEDEARQVAERAWLDGHTQAVVLTPRGSWGERVFEAFRDRWERLGGLLAEHQKYNAKENDFSKPIRALLNIDESYARKRGLQQLLGKNLEFEPRLRKDADFIFLVAKSQKARQIRPQLQFHHASGLPVYGTSHIYSGKPAPGDDQDLEGIKFPDIPWLLVAGGNEPLARENLAESLSESQSRYPRLYAMGIDSFSLLPHLARLQTTSRETLDGKTGNLYLDEINQIHRQLVWAEMHKGTPRIIGYAPRLDLDIGETPMPSAETEAVEPQEDEADSKSEKPTSPAEERAL